MAGIGFELKKLFKERSVVNLLKGAFYSTFTTIGPMIIFIAAYLLLYIILGYQNINYHSKDLLTGILLYVFIFSLIFTSPVSAVVSRYVADKIFEEKLKDIMASYYAGLLINVVLSLIFAVPFICHMLIAGKIDPLLTLSVFCMFAGLLVVFFNMTYLSALKEYKSISISFLTGMGVAIVTAFIMHNILGVEFVLTVVSAGAFGIVIIAFLLYALIKRFFGESNKNYREFLGYFKRYFILFLTNLCYILGLYVHNFVFWGHRSYQIVVDQSFVSAPVYDTATFIAMLTSVSATVIFTVRVEINFHEKYQAYCQELIGGVGRAIVTAKNNMFSTLIKEVTYIVQTQIIITIVMFLVFMIFGQTLGFGGMVLVLYPSMAAAYFVVFIMYGMIVFLYYFDDRPGAFITSFIFLAITFFGALIAKGFDPVFQGIGPFIGGFAAFGFSYFRLRYIEKNLDRQMYCRGEIIKRKPLKSDDRHIIIPENRRPLDGPKPEELFKPGGKPAPPSPIAKT